MTLNVRVEVRRNQFGALADTDWRPVFGRVAVYFDAEMDAMFASEGASRGHPWQPLAPSTAAQKASMGLSPQILIRSGTLRNSFRARELTPTRLVYGTDARAPGGYPYPKAHDEGLGNVPERPLLRIIPRDVETIEGLFRDHIETRGAGGGAGS